MFRTRLASGRIDEFRTFSKPLCLSENLTPLLERCRSGPSRTEQVAIRMLFYCLSRNHHVCLSWPRVLQQPLHLS